MAEESSKDTNQHEGFAAGPEGDQPMSFFDHVTELRKRLMLTVVGLVVGAVVAFVYIDAITLALKLPLVNAWQNAGREGAPQLQALNMQAPVMVDFWVAFMTGIGLSLPITAYQGWMFVAPGLYAREKKFVIPFVIVSGIMFFMGAAFAYSYVVPFIYQFFIEYTSDGELVQPEMSAYYKGTSKIILAFGLVFEFPLLITFLAKFKMVTERTLLKAWKFSMLAIVVLAALLTPPEPVSQLMMAAPMVLLYFISVGLAWIINPYAKTAEFEMEREARAGASPGSGDDLSGPDEGEVAAVDAEDLLHEDEHAHEDKHEDAEDPDESPASPH